MNLWKYLLLLALAVGFASLLDDTLPRWVFASSCVFLLCAWLAWLGSKLHSEHRVREVIDVVLLWVGVCLVSVAIFYSFTDHQWIPWASSGGSCLLARFLFGRTKHPTSKKQTRPDGLAGITISPEVREALRRVNEKIQRTRAGQEV